MTEIASLFASIGFNVDVNALRRLDNVLKNTAQKINELTIGETVSDPTQNDAKVEATRYVLPPKEADKYDWKKTNEADKATTETSANDLSSLGNKALIANLKKHKDMRPSIGIRVQISAMRSKATLIEYWRSLSAQHGALLHEKNYYITTVNSTNIGTIYRLQIGDFTSESDAGNFCDRFIKETNKSRLDCVLVKGE